VSILPEHSKDFEKTAKLISGKLDLPLLAVFIYDSDVLSSTIYHQGKVIDLYSSHPDYFQKVEPRVAQKYHGNPEKYDLFLDSPKDIQQLGELFDAMRGAILCATDLPGHFAKLLGLTYAWTSYDYLQNFDETEEIEQWEQFVHLPLLDAKIQAQKKIETEFQRELDILREKGILKTTVELRAAKNDPKTFVHWAAMTSGSLLLVHSDCYPHVPWEQLRNKPLLCLAKPWTEEPVPLGIEVKPHLFSINASPSGKYAVFGYSNSQEIWDIPNRSLLGAVSICEHFWRAYFSKNEEQFFVFTDNEQDKNWFLIKTLNGTIIKIGSVHFTINSGTAITAFHPSGEWFALGMPGKIQVGNIETGQTLTVPIGTAKDLASMIAPQIHEVMGEIENNPAMLESIPDEWKQQLQKFANSPFVLREHVYSLAFCNDYLCCGTDVAMRAYSWDAITTSKSGNCLPCFVHFWTDRIRQELNGRISGLYPAPTRNHCLFGQGRKLISMNLADGLVTELMTLPVYASIVQIVHLGDNTFALEVWVSFPHYGRNIHPRYLYIVELPRQYNQT
ncbi:MAG: hypothetical protein FWD31_07620, partial [Planctomycetaceae bacterium]|nr:hypothetical protein [Planctomycetaceae bacterium]